MKSEVTYASNLVSAAFSGVIRSAPSTASRKIDRTRDGSSLATSEKRIRGSPLIARCTGANIV
jgi:hypothetical protein